MSGFEQPDPAGVRALLDLLRSTQDGGSAGASSTAGTPPNAQKSGANAQVDAEEYVPQSGKAQSVALASSGRAGASSAQNAARAGSSSSNAHQQDLRNISFGQALPILTRLSQERDFLAALVKLKQEQDSLENELADARLKITGTNGEKLTGPGAALVQGKLSAFDRTVLKRWDELRRRQQEALQALGVPCFFPSSNKADLVKQERVMHLLGGLLESEEPGK